MKKQKITQQDYLKAHRKASREEEIARHGRPARFRAVHKSKKAYDRKREKAGLRNLPFSFHIKIYSHSSPPACLRFGRLVQHMQTDDGLTLYFSAASLNVLNISPVVMHLIFRFLCRIACFDLQTLQPPPFNKLPGHACQILLHSAHCTNIGLFLPTNVPMILIAGDKFAISATNSSGVLRPLTRTFRTSRSLSWRCCSKMIRLSRPYISAYFTFYNNLFLRVDIFCQWNQIGLQYA